MNLQQHEYDDPFGDRADEPSLAPGASTQAAAAPAPTKANRGKQARSPPPNEVNQPAEPPPASVKGVPITRPPLQLLELDAQIVFSSPKKFEIVSLVREATSGAVVVQRTFPQLLALRIEVAKSLPFHVVPTLPTDATAFTPVGREHVLAFLHQIATSSVTGSHGLVRLFFGYEGTADEVERTFKYDLGALMSLDLGRQSKFDLAKIMAKVSNVSERALESNVGTIAFRVVDVISQSATTANFFWEHQQATSELTAAWQAAAASAIKVRSACQALADATAAVGDPWENLAEAMFWPWTKGIIIQGTAMAASKAAIMHHAAKIRPPRPATEQQQNSNGPASACSSEKFAAAAAPAAAIDHNLNPGVEHPTIRLRRYLGRGANICHSIASTGGIPQVVTASLHQSMLLCMFERHSECAAAGLAQVNLKSIEGVKHLPDNAKLVRKLLSNTPSNVVQCEEQLLMMEAETTRVAMNVNSAVSAYTAHARELRGGAKALLHQSLVEATKAQMYCTAASRMIIQDLIDAINLDPFLDEEDRPFRDPLVHPPPSSSAEVDAAVGAEVPRGRSQTVVVRTDFGAASPVPASMSPAAAAAAAIARSSSTPVRPAAPADSAASPAPVPVAAKSESNFTSRPRSSTAAPGPAAATSSMPRGARRAAARRVAIAAEDPFGDGTGSPEKEMSQVVFMDNSSQRLFSPDFNARRTWAESDEFGC